MQAPWITSDEARAACAYAESAGAIDALRLGTDLQRRFGLSAEQRAAVLTQAELRARAAKRWGTPVDDLLFTRDGLEQATRPRVAQWRAARLAAFGVHSIADLGCGLGFESRALSAAGLRVHAIDIDAQTAALAAHNLTGRHVSVTIGDITDSTVLDPLFESVDALFLDPARRDPTAPRSIDGLSGHRVADPSEWSPSWPWILDVAQRQPRTVVKTAPGIDHALIPQGGSAVWMSADGDLVEASIWFPGFETLPSRSAVALSAAGASVLHSQMPVEQRVRAVGDFLLDVAPVVTRSGLVTTLAAEVSAARIDEHIGYLTSDAVPAPSPFHTVYRVIETLPFDRKRIATWLRANDAASLTVMKRGFAADTEALGREWRKACSGSRAIVIALTRIGDAPLAIIGMREPVPES